MSYGVHAYIADIPKLFDAIGSKNSDLIAEVEGSNAGRIEQWDRDPFNKEGSLKRAIGRLINGDFEGLDASKGDGRERSDLGYALECLVSHMSGGQLGTGEITSITGGWLYKQPVLNKLCGDAGPLAKIMPMPDDFPAICIIPAEQLDATFDAGVAAKNANPDPQSEPCYKELMFWLDQVARDEREGLITFYY